MVNWFSLSFAVQVIGWMIVVYEMLFSNGKLLFGVGAVPVFLGSLIPFGLAVWKGLKGGKRLSFEEELRLRHQENQCKFCGQSFTFRQDMYAHESGCKKRPYGASDQINH